MQGDNPPEKLSKHMPTLIEFLNYISITSVPIDKSAHSLHQNKGNTLGHPFISIKYIIYGDVISSKAIIQHKTQIIAPIDGGKVGYFLFLITA